MEEISLREIIEIIIKGKWIISIVTIVFMLGSIVVSFFVLEPQYKAQTMLMISPILNAASQNKDNNNFSDLVGTLSQYPQMTIDTYKEQVKAPVILQYIREQMNMKNTSLRSIADRISVNAIKNTNLLNIVVDGNNPEEAAQIANLVSRRFTEFVTDTNKKQAENSAQFIRDQMEKEKVELNKSSERLKEFLSKPRGPAELKLEVDSKLTQLTEFKTEITQIKMDEEVTKSSLEQSKELLKNTPEKLIMNRTVFSDNLISDIIKENGDLKTEDLANIKLSDEQINSIYLTLKNSVNSFEIQLSTLTAQRNNMDKEIGNRQAEIEVLQAELAQKQQEFDILEHEVELIKQTYDAYQQKYKESMIKQAAEIGESSIVVVSEAIPPINPVGPRKAFNLAIAMAIGIVGSIFALFIKEYLYTGNKESKLI